METFFLGGGSQWKWKALKKPKTMYPQTKQQRKPKIQEH